jgi:predicted PurR-regulated permease PerM
MTNLSRGITILILLVLAVIGVGFILGETFDSLVIAFIFAYFLFPVIEKIENWGIPRSVITIFFIVLFLGILSTILYFAIPAIFIDLRKFILLLPERIAFVTQIFIQWGDRFGFDFGDFLRKYADQKHVIFWIEGHMEQFSQLVLLPMLKISGKGLVGIKQALMSVLNLFIIPIFFFFLVNSYEKITTELGSLLPEKQRKIVANYLETLNLVLSGYFRGQIGLSFLVSFYYALCLSLTNIHFGLVIGLLTGLINMIPYVGITISVILSVLSISFYSNSVVLDLSLIAFIYGFEIFIEMVYLYPKFVGSKIGLKPLEIMLALAAGVNVAGIVGALVAVPLAAVLKVILLDAIRYYKQSDLYQKLSM